MEKKSNCESFSNKSKKYACNIALAITGAITGTKNWDQSELLSLENSFSGFIVFPKTISIQGLFHCLYNLICARNSSYHACTVADVETYCCRTDTFYTSKYFCLSVQCS